MRSFDFIESRPRLLLRHLAAAYESPTYILHISKNYGVITNIANFSLRMFFKPTVDKHACQTQFLWYGGQIVLAEPPSF